MFAKLFAGVAVAAAAAVPQVASAGHGPCCTCPPRVSYGTSQGGWHYSGSAMPGHLQPSMSATARTTPSAPADQPPVASGESRVIRRFSYEPGTDAVGQGVPAAPVFQSVPTYRPAAPVYRSSRATTTGQSRGGLTGEARLHPGRGRNR